MKRNVVLLALALGTASTLTAQEMHMGNSQTMPSPPSKATVHNSKLTYTKDIAPILQQRCAACHSAHPTLMGAAPAGVMFDTPEEISQNAQRLYQQAVTLKAMPLGNVTHMTDDERQKIAAWFQAGAEK